MQDRVKCKEYKTKTLVIFRKNRIENKYEVALSHWSLVIFVGRICSISEQSLGRTVTIVFTTAKCPQVTTDARIVVSREYKVPHLIFLRLLTSILRWHYDYSCRRICTVWKQIYHRVSKIYCHLLRKWYNL